MYTIKIDKDHKKKHHVYRMTAMLFLLFLSSVNIASAHYDFDGVPSTDQLLKVVHDSVVGGVIIDGGHGLGNAKNSPFYTQSFSIPNGQINYSRLYVGVWGGTETKTGTLQTTFNGHEFDSIDLEGKFDTNENVNCSGHGVYWVTYNSTKYTTSGLNSAIARTSGTIDGRVNGIILVAVYADNTSEQKVEYWINEGNPNLYSSSDSHPSGNKEAHAYFSGITNIHPPAARLSVVYLAGNKGQNDYLHFNDNKLNGDDVAASSDSFDLLTFDVTDYLESSSNAKFDVGDESYLHPVLAVLTVYTGDLEEESDLIVKKVAVGELYTNDENIISANIENIGTSPAFGFSTALYSDDIMVSKAQVSSIGPDQNKSVNFTWEPVYTGQHNLRVMVDYTDLVAELRETNNNNTPFTVDILDHTPPNITIDQPQYDETITYQTITVKGTIEDADKNITMVVNGIDTICSGGKWSVLIPIDEGMNKIIVNAIDGSNNTATEFVIINGNFNGSGQQSVVGTDLQNNSTINENSSTQGNDSSMYTTNCPGAVTLLCLLLIIYRIKRAI
ncbi:MAG: DUF3344 domain-containing protein [Methanosarcinales archaeon]|nr:DUF3344 domain-containing protein [Methanosarcinales archaeon]